METNDIFEIANILNNSLLILKNKYNKEFNDKFTVNIQLPENELIKLDHDFHILQNGNEKGFTPSEEIKVKAFGINFVITKEEEEIH